MSRTDIASSALAQALRALRQRNYRLYCLGQVVSLLGTSMQSIGLTWLVLELTKSAWQLGLVGALQAVPVLLFALFGGVAADRWPKRNILLVTQMIEMLQAGLLWLLVISGKVQLWQLYVLALLLGCMSSLSRPANRAFIGELVRREDLPNAIALNASLTTLAIIVGPGLAGIVLTASSASSLFLLNALSFLAVIVGLLLIKADQLHTEGRVATRNNKEQPVWQSLRVGIVYIGQTPTVLLIMIVVGLVLLFGANLNVILPLFARDILQVGTTGYGMFAAASGVGALCATVWLALRNHKPTLTQMLIATLLFGIVEVLFSYSRSYPLSIILLAGIGCAESIFAAQAMTILHTVVPDQLRGRVMSVQVLCFDGSLPLGYMLMGWLSSAYGPVEAVLIGAILCLLVTIGGWLWWSYGETYRRLYK